MRQRVLTYSNIEQLYAPDSIFMKQYNDAIHITATNSLRRALVENNAQRRWIDAPIISFGQLVKNIGYGWFRSKTMLKQMIELTKIYDEFGKQKHVNREIFKAFDRNQKDVYATMRALIESAYTSKIDLTQIRLSEEEKLFFDLYSRFEKHKSVGNFHRWFNDFYKGKEELLLDALVQTLTEIYEKKDSRRESNLIPKVFNKKESAGIRRAFENEQDEKTQQRKINKEKAIRKAQYELEHTFKKKRVLVFHGFYFITPVQELFFKGLERFSNVEIVHVIHYDKDYPQIFETVERFLDLRHAQQVSDSPFPINTLANNFANRLAGDQTTINTRTSHYYAFDHIYQFKNYLEQDDEQGREVIFSPRAKEADKYVSGLDRASDAKLKDYPIGQFLLDLHRFNQSDYSIDAGEFNDAEKLNSDVLIRLFNSGYLYIPKKNNKYRNGTHLVESLIKLEPIVKNCVTFEQWEETLTEFIANKNSIEACLKPENYEPTDDKDLYVFENQSLAYLNVSVSNLKMILKGIDLLKEFYTLSYEGETLSISQYVDNLQNYMGEKVTRFMKDADEKKLTKKLLSELNELKEDEDFDGINRKDIIKGLSFFLSKANDEESLVMEQTDESSTNTRVRQLVDGDGIAFENNRNIHLAFMDNLVLPLGQHLSLWPMKEETINTIISTRRTKLRQLQLRKEMTGSITAYLIYLIMQKATKITLSYATNFEDENNLYPSFYMQLLDLEPYNYNPLTSSGVGEQYEKSAIKHIEVMEREKSFILNKTAYACQRRFVLSYLLQKRPDFESDFHHQFIYSSLYSYYSKLRKYRNQDTSENEIVSFVDSMFPQWTDTKKSMLLKQARGFTLKGCKPERIEGLTIWTSPKPIALIGLNNRDYNKKPTSFVTNSSKCKYCPFVLQCRQAGEDIANE
ncbi:hypothetical protein [Aquibacillus rhizosphaerae]|uniref:PD-(D/E)XK endonuclease-like domain-containing protein n=1 Tax=Aquibacillus rhizosphaerae TaxID=3051431 RepID=A0ABT7LD37_9BACI|nr:hypothetical protein [Aquibacillus sp. LR5S19]MDL4842466.1 hypothetical protein [Aquibacillus sp. LR5S19]